MKPFSCYGMFSAHNKICEIDDVAFFSCESEEIGASTHGGTDCVSNHCLGRVAKVIQ